MTVRLSDVVAVLEDLYPPAWAQSWDAVGLVCGDPDAAAANAVPVQEAVAAVAREHRGVTLLQAGLGSFDGAIEEPVNAIVDAVKTTLDKCPPELSGDIMDRGIVLTGGGALLRGLDERLRRETGMPIHIAEDPLDSVALGSGKCVEEFEALQQVLDAQPRR